MTQVNNRVLVILLNGDSIMSTYRGYLPIQDLSHAVRQGDVLPGLIMSLLILVNQLCNNWCKVHFTDVCRKIKQKWKKMFVAKQNHQNEMYVVDFLNLSTQANPALSKPLLNNVHHVTCIKEVIEYLYCCCFSPPMELWCKAIDCGFLFQTWPHLMSKLVRNPSTLHLRQSLGTKNISSKTYGLQKHLSKCQNTYASSFNRKP